MSQHESLKDVIDNLPGMPQRSNENIRSRDRRFFATIGAILLALVVGTAALYYGRKTLFDAPIPMDLEARYTGIEQGYTDDGFPRLGSPDAPVVVEEFSSFACPHCRDFHDEQFADLMDEIANGQVQFVYIPIAHIGPGAETAAKAALCAGKQDRFWEMHDVLFHWQKKFLISPFSERRINKGAALMGLDAASFERCLDGAEVDAVIEQARSEFERRDLTGTPSIYVNGERIRDYRELENLEGS